MNAADRIRLQHMLDYSRDAVRYAAEQTPDSLRADEVRVRALIYTVGVIGEAAANVSRELQEPNPQIPWAQVIAMRNRLFHGYTDINYERLWLTVKEAIPQLVTDLEKLLASE